jgi:GR25 family glycosyltransferase involved in LPS biosynthesis
MSRHIDKIYYINLDKRKDRLEEINEELSKFGLLDKAERITGIYDADQGCVGCGKSHIETLKKAKESGCKNVLVLEDDFMFTCTKEYFESQLESFFTRGPSKWDVLFLQCNLAKYDTISEFDNLKKVTEGYQTSSYIINSHYIDTVLAEFEKAVPLLEKTRKHWLYAIDTCWHPLQKKDNFYVFNPMLGQQRPSFSDCTLK